MVSVLPLFDKTVPPILFLSGLTMRLYNPTSCTPMASPRPTGSNWSPPKAYLPKTTKFNNTVLAYSPHKLSAPSDSGFHSKKSGVYSKVSSRTNATAEMPSGTGIQLFPSRVFHFDIDEHESTGDELSSSSGYDDILSRSSTLSTHFILNTVGEATKTTREAAYGIRMPFPSHVMATKRGEHCNKPRVAVDVDIKKRHIDDQLSKEVYPFQTVPSISNSCFPRPSLARDSLVLVSVKATKSNREAPSRHAACQTQGVVASSINVTADDRDFYCPQLASTESDESSWLDFSGRSEENPFHAATGDNETSCFTPIEQQVSTNKQSKPDLLLLAPEPCHPRKGAASRVEIVHPKKSAKPNKPSWLVVPATLSGLRGGQAHHGQPTSVKMQELRNSHVGYSDATNDMIQSKKRAFSTHGVQKKLGISTTDPKLEASISAPPAVSTSYPENPNYTKYSAMLTAGFSFDDVKNVMERDLADPAIIELLTLASTRHYPTEYLFL
jgi:hypothetical protein